MGRCRGLRDVEKGALLHMTSDFDNDGFFGRDQFIVRIIDTLTGSGATASYRSILVEGPSQRGKTWLLQKIAHQLEVNLPCEVIVCLFEGRTFPKERAIPAVLTSAGSFSDGELANRLFSQLWTVVYRCCGTLPWPTGLDQSDPELWGKIQQFLKQYTPSKLIEELHEKIDQANIPILLIILDGMDEVEEQLLKVFEREFMAVLFRNPRVRLLASRRVDSINHRWRTPIIRLQNKFEKLERYDGPEEQPANPQAKQIKHLLSTSSLTFKNLQRQMVSAYPWASPGANAFLVRRARAHGGVITDKDIRDCLQYLMRSSRDPNPTDNQIDDQTFDYIARMIKDFPDIDTQGAPRYEINDVLGGMSDKERDAFLGRLQDRGIGNFGNSGNYFIHTDFVELFGELQARKNRK